MKRKDLKSFLKSKRLIANFFISLASVIAFYATDISPESNYLFAFYALTIPVWLMINVLYLIYWLRVKPVIALLSLFTLFLGYHHINASLSVSFNLFPHKEKNAFQVLSYNVRVFNVYPHFQEDQPREIIEWLTSHPAEIKCVQEFYNLSSDTLFNTIEKIGKKQGYHYHFSKKENIHNEKGYFGTGIFSKYPIIQAGDFPLDKKEHQKGVFADILINHDTVRIVNIHLQSIYISEEKLWLENSNLDRNTNNLLSISRRLKRGFVSRAKQMFFLKDFLEKSPYPLILCGDLNDTPYSYTYQQLKHFFYNAFEQAGGGLGFTYRGNIPFLRIDNQFFSEGIRIKQFKTLKNIPYSDHYPISGEYVIDKK